MPLGAVIATAQRWLPIWVKRWIREAQIPAKVVGSNTDAGKIFVLIRSQLRSTGDEHHAIDNKQVRAK